MRLGSVLAATSLILAVSAAPARATETPHKVRYGPITLNPYEVKRGDQVFDVPKPNVSGSITKMSARLVYSDGRPVPIANTMLHHVVLADLGRYVGDHQDATCDRFRMFDSQSYLPLAGHRFYGIGEERHKLLLPPGYGYPTEASDRWAMTYMLMNHLSKAETVFVEFDITIDDNPTLKPVTPVWLDVRNCNLDPVYNVRGGGKRGSTHRTSTTWRAPEAGRLVFGTGHLHGGGKVLHLTKPDCGDKRVFTSRPLWGRKSHPYYQVKPLLHEPGPISMTTFQSQQGIPVAAGERVELTSIYDRVRPHVRVMGIMIVAFAPDPTLTQRCLGPPGDMKTFFTEAGGRKRAPKVTVPLTTWNGTSRARKVKRAPGPRFELASGDTVDVAETAFSPANVVVRRGARLNWRFFGTELHNVTLANGPRGFSSDNLNRDRTFSYRFKRPGTYRLFCTLHPVRMPATVRVRR